MKSILDSTKKILGIDEAYEAFNLDILTHINTAFSTLSQIGIGPKEGFEIIDETTEWDEYLNGDLNKNAIKTYIYLRVRLLFDPPQTGHHMAAVNEQIKELEWRLNVFREEDEWTDPNTATL